MTCHVARNYSIRSHSTRTQVHPLSGTLAGLLYRRLLLIIAVATSVLLAFPQSSLAQNGAPVDGRLSARTVAAKDTEYIPAQDFPNGRQIEAVYFGASWCSPCQAPSMKAAVRAMKPLLAAQARNVGATFSAMVVALDRSFASGTQFIAPLGAFDEYSIGADLASTAAQEYIWSDSLGTPVVPQVIVFERMVTVIRRHPMTFGPRHVLLRIMGDSIPLWVAAGAPVQVAKQAAVGSIGG